MLNPPGGLPWRLEWFVLVVSVYLLPTVCIYCKEIQITPVDSVELPAHVILLIKVP